VKVLDHGTRKQMRAVWMDGNGIIWMIDQRKLPAALELVSAIGIFDIAGAIKDMTVRGAPAIGATAALGIAQAAAQGLNLDEAGSLLKGTRPTAHDLAFAVDHTVRQIRAGKDPRFASLEETEQYVRKVSAPFGPLTDAQWRHLTEHNAKRFDDGRWGMNYDPAIALPFRKAMDRDIVLWKQYDAVRCPTLLLRGAESDLLLRETALEMTQRGPKPRLIEFAGIGHAPVLMADDQIAAVREFLLGT